MKKEQKSFVLYNDYIEFVKKLPAEDAGKLFLAILEYKNYGTEPQQLPLAADVSFGVIKSRMDRDSETWEEIKRQKVESGAKGGRASGVTRRKKAEKAKNGKSGGTEILPQNEPKLQTLNSGSAVTSEKPHDFKENKDYEALLHHDGKNVWVIEADKANEAVNVNVNDNVNVNVNENVNVNDNVNGSVTVNCGAVHGYGGKPPAPPTVNEEKGERLGQFVPIVVNCGETPMSSAEVIALYNGICVSLPKVQSLSKKREELIKDRISKYSVNDFKLVFYNAESSSFLKGMNPRKWVASFDWIMQDGNFEKILEGNYDDRGALPHTGTYVGSERENEFFDVIRGL